MVLPFGKYADIEIKDIPTEYLQWCLLFRLAMMLMIL